MPSFPDLARAVEAQLGQHHRYAHTVRVARLGDRLAQQHGEDPRRARLAGMLHDLARLYSAQQLVEECEAREMPIDAFERRNPIVLHARLGAELARERFGVNDEGVLQAIRRHTLGAPGMSRLEAIVYVADGLEPGRSFDARASLEALAFEDLDAAVAAVIRSGIAYLRANALEPAPQTLAALAAYERFERSSLSA